MIFRQMMFVNDSCVVSDDEYSNCIQRYVIAVKDMLYSKL